MATPLGSFDARRGRRGPDKPTSTTKICGCARWMNLAPPSPRRNPNVARTGDFKFAAAFFRPWPSLRPDQRPAGGRRRVDHISSTPNRAAWKPQGEIPGSQARRSLRRGPERGLLVAAAAIPNCRGPIGFQRHEGRQGDYFIMVKGGFFIHQKGIRQCPFSTLGQLEGSESVAA